LSVNGFTDRIPLRKTPAQEIQQVRYVDGDGVVQTASSTLYELDQGRSELVKVFGESWPTAQLQQNAVMIDFWAGFYDPTASPINPTSDVPEDIRIAILLMVEHLYSHRGQSSEIQLFTNPVFDLLIGSYWMPV
jgi:uncharacterized phiE125 gp8 family phage protein